VCRCVARQATCVVASCVVPQTCVVPQRVSLRRTSSNQIDNFRALQMEFTE